MAAAARHIRVGQLVHQRDLGVPRQHRVEVHLLELGAAVVDQLPGHDLQVAYVLGGMGPAVGLDEAHHHVPTPLPAPPALVQHGAGLANSGGGAEVEAKSSGGRDQGLAGFPVGSIPGD